MTIYTKKGDKGTTTLFEKDIKKRKRIFKDSLEVNAIGAVDELNSYLGVTLSYIAEMETKKELSLVQDNLFIIGSILAQSDQPFTSRNTEYLEKRIDQIEEELPPLRNFILPGGTLGSVHLMYARSLTRKAEREVVSLSRKRKVKPEVVKYLNRLSDYLFCVSRLENVRGKGKETIWFANKKV